MFFNSASGGLSIRRAVTITTIAVRISKKQYEYNEYITRMHNNKHVHTDIVCYIISIYIHIPTRFLIFI